jgi:hypothetical protein
MHVCWWKTSRRWSPEGSRASTLLASTGEQMSFYEAARQLAQIRVRLFIVLGSRRRRHCALA